MASLRARVCVCMSVCVCVCHVCACQPACVCVSEREREREIHSVLSDLRVSYIVLNCVITTFILMYIMCSVMLVLCIVFSRMV